MQVSNTVLRRCIRTLPGLRDKLVGRGGGGGGATQRGSARPLCTPCTLRLPLALCPVPWAFVHPPKPHCHCPPILLRLTLLAILLCVLNTPQVGAFAAFVVRIQEDHADVVKDSLALLLR